jgi:hypothetical protein
LKNFDQNLLYYIFRYGGVFFVFYIILILIQYFKTKKKIYRKIEELILEFKTNNTVKTFIILDEQKIEFKNPINNISTIWSKTSYISVNDYLIIKIVNDALYYIFKKEEFETNNYQTLLSFLEKYSTKTD